MNTIQYFGRSELRKTPYWMMVRFSRWDGLWEKGKPYVHSFAEYMDLYRCELDHGEVHFNRRGWAYEDATKAERKQLRRTAVRVLEDEGWTKAPALWVALRQVVLAVRYRTIEARQANSYSFGTLYRKGLRYQWLNFKTIEGIVDGTGTRRYFSKGRLLNRRGKFKFPELHLKDYTGIGH